MADSVSDSARGHPCSGPMRPRAAVLTFFRECRSMAWLESELVESFGLDFDVKT